jgi:hypothetical protein
LSAILNLELHAVRPDAEPSTGNGGVPAWASLISRVTAGYRPGTGWVRGPPWHARRLA